MPDDKPETISVRDTNPPDLMRQLESPVSGYRGVVSDVRIAPDGDSTLQPGPNLPKIAELLLTTGWEVL